MLTSSPRQNGVAIACILSGGMIAAAMINSHRPVVISPSSGTALVARATPPISQESAKQQFEQQMAACVSHTVGETMSPSYTFKGVESVEVSYSAKDDAFEFDFTPMFERGNYVSYNSQESITAVNDGYGHYRGRTNVGGNGEDARLVSVVIR